MANGSGVWKSFVIDLSLLLLAVVSGLFLGIFFNMQKVVEAEMLGKARAIYDGIVMTRSWNSHYDGVYVEKKPGVESNPYLRNPDIETVDGKVFTKKNPALMTREISEIAETQGAFQFHITSLKPVNPGNAPDAAEIQALRAFEQGEKEVFLKEAANGSNFFRYMGPLFVQESCLPCHAEHGYRVGDVRGGISVRFNIDQAEKTVDSNRLLTGVLFLITASSLLLIVYSLVFRLYRRLSAAEQRIREMAITDELTGLRNRRYLFDQLKTEFARATRSGQAPCLIMFDIDHFKNINDVYGHDAGDRVLQVIGEAVRQCCRETDIGARYGGEEFAILVPGSTLDGSCAAAKKLRARLEGTPIRLDNGESLHVTASFGVACTARDLGPHAIEQLIKRADQALYRAKESGRNRVCVAGAPPEGTVSEPAT